MFSVLSNDITKSLTMTEKKKDGIFFTPKPIREKCFEIINSNLENKNDLLYYLEPSCGGCDFIDDIDKNNKIIGVEYNKTVYEQIKHLKNDRIELINEDFLLVDNKLLNNPDIIIGNPPYFNVDKEMKKKYENIYKTKAKINIYIYFMIKSFELLKEGGILVFVIPITIMNTKSYNFIRTEIFNNYTILELIRTEKIFKETKQDTCILAIKKIKGNNEKYIIADKNNIDFVFEENKHFNTMKKIKDIDNVKLNVGSIVWTQHKDNLTDDDKDILLVYDSNFSNNEFRFKSFSDNTKKQYIKQIDNKKINTGKSILIKRGYNNTNILDFILIDNPKYYCENHVYILKTTDVNLEYLKNILSNEKTKEYVKNIIGEKSMTIKDILNIPLFE